jgi:hypothetical protein
MKIPLWVFLVVVIAVPATLYLVQYLRMRRAQKKGLALYATVMSVAPVKFLGKVSEMLQVRMSIQEPGQKLREVSLRSRVGPGQRIVPGAILAVVVDPTNPKRVYPAGPDAMNRMTLTGSREQRRAISKQRR